MQETIYTLLHHPFLMPASFHPALFACTIAPYNCHSFSLLTMQHDIFSSCNSINGDSLNGRFANNVVQIE
jgi:hypothetical protein